MKTKLRNQKGFTIIEVLIVLAIAGLIMLIVFLAVPALQRNSRNTQRTNDAALVLAAVSECLNNRSGLVAECSTPAKIGDFADITKLKQLVTIDAAGSATSVGIVFSSKCNPAASGPEGGKPRQFVALYKIEGASAEIPRCIES